MEYKVAYENNSAFITLSRHVYDKEAILAAAYLLTGKYVVDISNNESDYHVNLANPDGRVDPLVVKSFVNNCLDEQLRIVLERRTGKIRELIVKHAFKPLDLKNELELAGDK